MGRGYGAAAGAGAPWERFVTTASPAPRSGVRARASLLAALALTVLVLSSPWFLGAVSPLAVRSLTLAAIASVLLAWVAGRGEASSVLVPDWPARLFLVLVLAQLLPLPATLHALLAPGSHAVWHPAAPAVVQVLGEGARPISVDPQATVRSLALAVGLVMLALLAAPALADVSRAVRIAVAITASGLVLSVYAIVARAVFGSLLYGRYAVPTVSPFGPFVSKNHFAGYVEMAALVAFGLALGLADRERDRSRLDWVRSPRAVRVLLAGGAGVAMSLAILASLSRGGILSLTAGLLLLLWIRRRTGRDDRTPGLSRRGLPTALLALGVGATVLFVLLPRDARERIAGMTGAASEQSGSFRLDTWRDSLRLAASSPVLGHGLGAFAEAYPRVKQAHGELRVEHAESDLLEVLAETGAVGFGLSVCALFLLTRAVLSGLRRRAPGAERGVDRVRRGVGAGALAAALTLAVHSAFDFNLRIPSNAALLALVAALAAGSAGPPLEPPSAWRRTRDLVFLALALVAGVWCLRTPVAPIRPGREDVALAASIPRPEARDLRLVRADAALTKGLRQHPADAESWYLLAWTRAARGRVPSALGLARQARSLDPTRPDLADALSRLETGLASRESPEVRR